MAANGSKEQLFAEVCASCTGLITRIALSYEADHSLRHELIQDIMLAIWLALKNYRGEASLKTRPADGHDAEIGRLKTKVGDLTMANELLASKIERLEAGRPLASRRSRR